MMLVNFFDGVPSGCGAAECKARSNYASAIECLSVRLWCQLLFSCIFDHNKQLFLFPSKCCRWRKVFTMTLLFWISVISLYFIRSKKGFIRNFINMFDRCNGFADWAKWSATSISTSIERWSAYGDMPCVCCYDWYFNQKRATCGQMSSMPRGDGN